MVPDSLSPSSFSLRVVSTFSPLRSTLHFQVPSGLASSAPAHASTHSTAIAVFMSRSPSIIGIEMKRSTAGILFARKHPERPDERRRALRGQGGGAARGFERLDEVV